MNKWLKWILVGILFIVLASIRTFEANLFYDPLITYFQGEYHTEALPDFNFSKLLLFTSLRFWVNSIISLVIIGLLFSMKAVRFSAIIYGLVFVVLLLAFIFLLIEGDMEYNFILFYVRRFLIQPLLIIILLPAFYYQDKVANSK